MKKKGQHLIFSLMFIFSTFSAAMGDSPAPPWSQVITSTNGKYVLILISPKVEEQEAYIAQSREFWQKGGIPAQDVPEAEKALQKEIDGETAIRKKYPESGLYTPGKVPKLLWKTDLYDLRAWVKVSNNSETMIVGRAAISPIFEEKPNEYFPGVNDVVGVRPNLEDVVLAFYSSGRLIRSYKARELTSVNENLQPNTNNHFVWGDEGELNDKEDALTLTKKNGEKLTFDMAGNLVRGKLQSQEHSTSGLEGGNVPLPKSEKSRFFCGGVALLVGLVLSILFGR